MDSPHLFKLFLSDTNKITDDANIISLLVFGIRILNYLFINPLAIRPPIHQLAVSHK